VIERAQKEKEELSSQIKHYEDGKMEATLELQMLKQTKTDIENSLGHNKSALD